MDHTPNNISIFNEAAKRYQDKFMNLESYHWSFDLFSESIEQKTESILEIGCGPGNITKYLLDKNPALKIHAIDLAPKMIELAQKNNPTASFEVRDAREVASLKAQFHGIMCGFCLPYLTRSEAEKLIAEATQLLLPGGLIYMSTMEADPATSGFKSSSDGKYRMFIHYHEADYLVAALKLNGFEILTEQRQDYPEDDGSVTVDLILIAKKG